MKIALTTSWTLWSGLRIRRRFRQMAVQMLFRNDFCLEFRTSARNYQWQDGATIFLAIHERGLGMRHLYYPLWLVLAFRISYESEESESYCKRFGALISEPANKSLLQRLHIYTEEPQLPYRCLIGIQEALQRYFNCCP